MCVQAIEPGAATGIMTEVGDVASQSSLNRRLRNQHSSSSLSSHPSLKNECVLRAATPEADNAEMAASRDLAAKATGFFDWMRLPVTEDIPRHVKYTREIGWSSTTLGTIEL